MCPTITIKKDLPLTSVDFKFCEAFYCWLTAEKSCNINGANKHLQRLKKIINYSIRAGYLVQNKTAAFSLTFKPFQPVAMDEYELDKLASFELKKRP